jgi:DNA-binding IscR family transcriptional regulator
MKLSRTSHYAVIALVHLARRGGQSATSIDIARVEAVPERFLLKILRPLARARSVIALPCPGRAPYRWSSRSRAVSLSTHILHDQ